MPFYARNNFDFRLFERDGIILDHCAPAPIEMILEVKSQILIEFVYNPAKNQEILLLRYRRRERLRLGAI